VVELLGADGAGVLAAKNGLVVVGYRDDNIIAQGTAERTDYISNFFWHCPSLPDKATGVLKDFDCAHDAFVCCDLDINRESLETRFAG